MPFGRVDPEALRKEREEKREASFRALAGSTVRPLARGTYTGKVAAPAAKVKPKIERKVRQEIRDSAKGEECMVRLPGVCTFDPEKTIWSHAPWGAAGKGRSTKSFDLAGCFCCTSCDAVIDRQAAAPAGMTREQVELAWCMGHFRSLERLAEKGLL